MTFINARHAGLRDSDRARACSFSLDCDVDPQTAEAKYENGVLQLTLPKKAANGRAKELRIS